MKIAEKSLHETSLKQIMADGRVVTEVSVRIYTSKKKAKRAIWALLGNGWQYHKPKYRPLSNGSGPLGKRVARKWYVVFFR